MNTKRRKKQKIKQREDRKLKKGQMVETRRGEIKTSIGVAGRHYHCCQIKLTFAKG